MRVLIIEDEPRILAFVRRALETEGLTVDGAHDGTEGIEKALATPYDLIVLDLMLPRMSGLDVCRLIRNEQPVPILILTARDSEQDVISGLEVGADDYVTKPFSMRELRARVNSLLRRDGLSRDAGPRADGPPVDVLAAGNLVLDVGRHEVRKAGTEVTLRPREFLLLEYLMRHPGQVLSRDLILERVWGYTYAGESRTVDVHVRWLREKLEDEPSSPRHIETVRGFGYRFTP